MRVLVGCEESGVIRDAFRKLGHDAYSCDLQPTRTEDKRFHLQCDILRLLYSTGTAMWNWDTWDLFIVHPPCTFTSLSGLHWNKRIPGRAEKTEAALTFVRQLMGIPIPRVAIEQPMSCVSSRIRKFYQAIQPYDFGEDASKTTWLWLKNLPLLVPTLHIPGRKVIHKGKLVERWSNQTDSGQNRLAPSPTRARDRAKTYQGIADAMAEQWEGVK